MDLPNKEHVDRVFQEEVEECVTELDNAILDIYNLHNEMLEKGNLEVNEEDPETYTRLAKHEHALLQAREEMDVLRTLLSI